MNLQNKNFQSFDWGELEWISEPDIAGNSSKLLIGKAIFTGTSSQSFHYHPDEQVLYIEKGEGVFQIGEKRVAVKPGSVCHTDPFCHHKVINESDDELVIMITYLPSSNIYKPVKIPELEFEGRHLEANFSSFIQDSVIQRSLERIAGLTGMHINILNKKGYLIGKGFNIPSFCRTIQQTVKGKEYCNSRLNSYCKKLKVSPVGMDIGYCCQKILRLTIPFSFQGNQLGYIICSGFLFEKLAERDYRDIKNLERLTGLYPGVLVDEYRKLHLVTKNNIYAASNLVTSMLENLLNNWLISESNSGLIHKKLDKSETYSEEIRAVIKYVRENITGKFTLDEIAEQVALNPSYLSRKFKQEVGKTLIQYINYWKVEKAKEMIRQGEDNFQEISYKLNFTAQSYFNKVFKNVSGMSPSEYKGE